MVTVLIVDDHPMYREGLRGLLESSAEVEVVGVAADGVSAVRAATELRPDVVLMDLQMSGWNGIKATEAIRARPDPPAILFLTMFHDEESLVAALQAGGQGYVLKGADGPEIVRAIHSVANGESIFSHDVAQTIMARVVGAPALTRSKPFPELTERERELLSLIGAGLGNQTIAGRLFISEKTVRNHITNIFVKIGVSTRAEAIVLAHDRGLIE